MKDDSQPRWGLIYREDMTLPQYIEAEARGWVRECMPDKYRNLTRLVFREDWILHDIKWTITACLTRFGGLCVLVMNDQNDELWQGDNILEARNWLDDK